MKLVEPSDLLVLLSHVDDVEVVVQLLDLLQVLELHFVPGAALQTLRVFLGEHDLINNNVFDEDFLAGEFLDQSFGFVDAEELWDANSYEGCLLSILHDLLQ